MPSRADRVARALGANTRAELRAALRPRRPELSVTDVRRLAQRLETLAEPCTPLRVGLVRTYTTELLAPYLHFEGLLHGIALEPYEAPYGALLQEVQPGAGLVAHRPDLTWLLLRWEDLEPRLAGPLTALAPADRAAAADAALDRAQATLAAFRAALPGRLVVTFLPPLAGPELGTYDAMAEHSEAAWRSHLKLELAARLRRDLPAVHFDDLDTLVAELGRSALFDARLWHSARFPFSVAGAQALARRLAGYAVRCVRPPAKCIVVDADNTLWGGIVGEEGPAGIALGPEFPGSVYVAFQERLLALRQRGLLLALSSKNNLEDVREVLAAHPHQRLREAHFAALRVDWEPKSANLRALAAELNLGLDAFVVVDDSAHECLEVSRQCPEVTVVQTPEDLLELPHCLDDLPELEILGLTAEDRERTALYAQERQRRTLSAGALSLAEYLAALDMTMTVGLDDLAQVPRIAQLTQKTNQFNLTTRRYTEAEVRRFVEAPDWLVAHFSLADVFGDGGIVGVALVRGLGSGVAAIDTFLMSCRVIGRQAEVTFLDEVLRLLAARGVRQVEAAYVPTAKNALVRDFWPERGFSAVGDGTFRLELGVERPRPSAPIRVAGPAPLVGAAPRR